MRANVVFFTLLGLLALLVGTLVLRGRDPHAAPQPETAGSASAAAPSASAPPDPAPAGSGLVVTPSQPKPKLGRALRVVGLGWDAIAPGLLANGSLAASDKGEFAKAGLKVAFEALDDPRQIEKALARGGGDESGADVAILPLPTFVASWERLRALELAAFHVVAWSRGRERLIGQKKLGELPAQGPIALAGEPGDAVTLLALFALDLSGVDPARVEIGKASAAVITAETRGQIKDDADKPRNVLLSTAEASRAIAWIAVAQSSLVSGQPDALIAFTKGFGAGQQMLAADAAAGARTIGNFDGAPEPLTLLERLGELEPVRLAENTELFALSGRGAVTLERLFAHSFRLWKASGVLTAPAPERTPIADRIVAGLARAEPKLLKEPAASAVQSKAAGTKVVLVRRIAGSKLDDDALIEELGVLAGIFHRSPLRVSVHGAPKAKAEEITRLAVDRYALASDRITLGKVAAKAGALATIEILEPR